MAWSAEPPVPPVLAPFTELFEICDTRPMKVVSGNASSWITVESPILIRDTSVSSTFTLVSRTLISLIVSIVAASLLKVPWIAVSPSSTLRRVTRGRRPLIDRVVRCLELRLGNFDLRPKLLELLIGHQSWVCFLERHQTVVVALRLGESWFGLRRLRPG